MKQLIKKCIVLFTIVMMMVTVLPRMAQAEDGLENTTVSETEQI